MRHKLAETENKIREIGTKASKWAKMSFWSGIISFIFPFFFFIFIFLFESLRSCIPFLNTIDNYLPFLLILFPLLAIICGIVGIVIIRSHKTILAGIRKAIVGIILGSLFFLCVLGIVQFKKMRDMAPQYLCAQNLSEIGKKLHQYASSNDNRYPSDCNWCDLLIKDCSVNENLFWCYSSEEGKIAYKNSNYALNPFAEPNSPSDLVLACETKYGWNQLADANIITADNHQNRGANVLFNDGHVEFIKKENFKNLNWKIVK